MSTEFVLEALRSIGEDLEFRGIRTFSILRDGDLFTVEGGYQPPPAAMPVTLHYSRKDIEELIRKSHERCDHLSARTSFIYGSEMLPAIAAYVFAKEGNLLGVSNTASTDSERVFEVECETRNGERVVERLTDAEVYALCVRAHKRRQKEKIAESRFTRFSSLSETNAAG